ncbi:MAG: S41 family peptidase, partial [Elusimicrobiales bacterium]|nr:S41 family peptidase [Elusimicrobiales bacterium]
AGSVSISRTFELGKDAFLRLSVARYFAPSGAELEGKGVVPDREVPAFGGFEELWRAPAESLFFRDAAWKAAVKGRHPSSAS